VHNVRLMWLKSAAPALLQGLDKLAADAETTPDELGAALAASGAAVSRLIEEAQAAGGRVKGFKPHVTAFVGYLVAHESHHRGQVTQILRLTGSPLDQKVSYGLWEWGVR
jgi:uncharacterized damage-inducible protein DinB